MKRNCTLILLLVTTFLLISSVAEAQRWNNRRRYSSLGVSLNAMNYFGDIVPEPNFTSFRFKSTRANVGLHYTQRFFPRVSGRASLHWGRLVGDDALSASENEAENEGRFRRNLSFRNDITELSAVAIIDLFENRSGYQRRPDFVPYGFIGIAAFHHNPKAYYERGSHPELSESDDIPTRWYALQPLGTEGQYAEGEGYPDPYKRIQVAIPFGLGVRYKLDRHWDLSFELTWRKTFTDYLDDVSGSYADKSDILSGGGSNPTAATILSDRSAEAFPGLATTDPSDEPYMRVPGYGTSDNPFRGHSDNKDWYILTGVHINYVLAPRIRSPKFR
ncbi:DUF6089 family protein [Pontibacter harenae]|uniref:DUF6089 family protein n=1 Tax=Pontibacter harenae TaxID=2894083 RepID=UPI001E3826D2|nr:DUF6089 family protein [Pontibacter harenae]MCC9168668.1 DUF6089 family protein [Pontibacter harenae]